jgi:acetyl/propionyl-CoA carboxylase alpha subunit
VDGKPYGLEVLDAQPGKLSLRFEGRIILLYWAADGNKKWISLDGCTYLLEKPSPHKARRPGERSAEDTIRAPMPAQVRSLLVTQGEEVEKGQSLLLLEAMKMEIRLQAPRKGRIARLTVFEGQSVDRDQVLLELE